MTARKKERSDSGKTGAGDVRSPYCNVLRIFPNLGLTLVDSDTQGEVDPEAEVPRERAMLAIRQEQPFPFPRTAASAWGRGWRGRGWRICRRHRGGDRDWTPVRAAPGDVI